MSDLQYGTAAPIAVAEVQPGDQVLSPYGYRVVFDAVEEGDKVRLFFWDEGPITRRAGDRIETKRRLT